MSILQSIKDQLKEWNSVGMNIPMGNDGTDKPSVTLFFAYISFIAVMLSLVYLHFNPNNMTPTLIATLVWSIALLIYRMRKIDSLKFDLDDKSFEIESEDEQESKKK
jgi:hypothetical protein